MPKSSTRYETLGDGKSNLVGSEGRPAAILKRCQERFHASLHACRHAWTRAGSALGPAAVSGEALRG
eukprot:332551-Pyramimonas_sp.AAC.1